jgi:hypothetical protein
MAKMDAHVSWTQGIRLRLRLHWSQTDTTQQSGQTPDKEVEIKNITGYVSDYTETDTTGMLSPPTVSAFSVAADINNSVFFISTSLSGVCPDCCVVSVLVTM